MNSIATVGDNCIDRYYHFGQSMVGGNAVNVAVHLSRQGIACSYFGAVGDDDAGKRTTACLQHNGVDITYVRVLPGITAFTDLDNDAHGDRIIAHENFGVCADYVLTDADFDRLIQMRHVHIGWLPNALELQKRLVAAGVSVSQDLAVNPHAQGLDIAFESVGPNEELARRRLTDLLTAGSRLAVVTCGPLGSFASDGTSIVSTGIRDIDVVDTTGAGDTFIAGFIGALYRGKTLKECLESGRDLAAITCTHVGGFSQLGEPLPAR